MFGLIRITFLLSYKDITLIIGLIRKAFLSNQNTIFIVGIYKIHTTELLFE